MPSALGKSAILDRLGEKDGKKGYALGAPVEIDGERFILSCLVRRVPNSQRLYVYELDAEKELRAPSTDASAKNKFLVELNSGQPGTINNVLHKLYAVNPLRENISIPLNQQTGEPATEFVSKIEIVITQGLINVSELYPRDAARKLYDTVGGDLSQRKRLTRSAAEAGLRIDFRAVDEAIAQGRPATTVKDLFLKAMTLDPSKQQSPKNNVKKGKTK